MDYYNAQITIYKFARVRICDLQLHKNQEKEDRQLHADLRATDRPMYGSVGYSIKL